MSIHIHKVHFTKLEQRVKGLPQNDGPVVDDERVTDRTEEHLIQSCDCG